MWLRREGCFSGHQFIAVSWLAERHGLRFLETRYALTDKLWDYILFYRLSDLLEKKKNSNIITSPLSIGPACVVLC